MYILKLEQKRLAKQDLNDCVYSPVKQNTLKMHNGTISIISPHELCTHKQYCIFNNNRTELEKQITTIQNTLSDYKRIKEAAINGEVIYHKGLSDFYNITSTEYIGLDGKKHYKFDVTLSERFINALNNKIINLEYDLENLNYFKRDILHGKIGGYGYGNQ